MYQPQDVKPQSIRQSVIYWVLSTSLPKNHANEEKGNKPNLCLLYNSESHIYDINTNENLSKVRKVTN